jgi:gamma-glutamylcyclotransferase (GGCT)/AIG2-like uncharacterized protein YtfP
VTAAYRLFIYGTLQRSERNAHLMAAARYLREAVTRDAAFSMGLYESKTFQGRSTPDVRAGGKMRLSGELYEVDDALLAELDAFERVGIEYVRTTVVLDDGSSAEIYLHAPAGAEPPRLAVSPQIRFEGDIASWSEQRR